MEEEEFFDEENITLSDLDDEEIELDEFFYDDNNHLDKF